MASTASSGGADRPPSPPNPQPKTKPRRRAKRDGPPQLQFVTATDPSQFKDEHAKRSVRSQAMIHYRNNLGKQRKKSEDSLEDAPTGQGPVVGGRTVPIMGHQHLLGVNQATTTSQVSEELSKEQQYLCMPTSVAWWCANLDSFDGVDAEEPDCYAPSRASSSTANKVVEYEDSDSHGEKQMRKLVGKLVTHYGIGDGVDPFMVVPQFKNPELNSLQLLRECMRGFASDATLVKWIPAMLSHPHILLSGTLAVSTWMDMRAGHPGDSKRTVMVKAETITMIKERLRNPDTQYENLTLMVILHLLGGEFWSCNERTLRIHQTGVARFITQRGGMHCLHSEVVAEAAAACCYHCDIFCDTKSLPIFRNWEPSQDAPTDSTAALPESPLFCPGTDFVTFVNDPRCSPLTYALLCDMRDLTNLFIMHNDQLRIVYKLDAGANARPSPPVVDYDIKVAEIRERLASVPSAYTPGLPTSNDWVYEACRITALIYATSIILRVPFSVAADPYCNPILSELGMLSSSAGGCLFTTRLTEALYKVLERTDTGNIWNDMSGVLYWISAVGAAAARAPDAINMTQQPRFRNEAYTVWVRRCLIMMATRTMLVLIFQHPIPVLTAQKRLLKVQELIRTGDVRPLVP